MLTLNESKSKLKILTGHKTLKAARNDPRYIKSFMSHGNAKLKDFDPEKDGPRTENDRRVSSIFADVPFKYAQFNLPAKKTCPFASAGCLKFCYAKRDERWPEVVANRIASFAASRENDFVARMIYTINVELCSKRYNGAVMVVRIHESGDFYNPEYLGAWIKIFDHFAFDNVIFQFYTKCFDYILNLNRADSLVLKVGTDSGHVGMSLSIDDTMSLDTKMKAAAIKAKYHNANIYYATNDDSTASDHVCSCEHCAKCAHCIVTTGENVIVKIH